MGRTATNVDSAKMVGESRQQAAGMHTEASARAMRARRGVVGVAGALPASLAGAVSDKGSGTDKPPPPPVTLPPPVTQPPQRPQALALWAVLSPDGGRAFIAENLVGPNLVDVTVLNSTSNEVLHTLTGHSDALNSIACSPDGNLALTTFNKRDFGHARLWNLTTGQLVRTLPDGMHGPMPGNDANHADFSPDGRFALVAQNTGIARVWRLETGEHVRSLTGHNASVTSAVISPNGELALTASKDTTAKLWNFTTGEELSTLRGHNEPVMRAAFSPDARFALTASRDGTAKVWNFETGEVVHNLQIFDSSEAFRADVVRQAAFSPDGKLALTAWGSGPTRVWNLTTGQIVHTLGNGGYDGIPNGVFFPDGRQVLTVSFYHAHVWDLKTGEVARTIDLMNGGM